MRKMNNKRFLQGHHWALQKRKVRLIGLDSFRQRVRSAFLSLIAALLVMYLTACALAPKESSPVVPSSEMPSFAWQSTLQTDRPLVGKIWWQKEGRFVSPSELLAELVQHEVVLLGEKHDNPDHHSIEAWLIQRLAESGELKSIYFEMLDMKQQAVLTELNARPVTPELSLVELKAQLKWPDKGWSWEDYGALIKQSFALELNVKPANVSREVVAGFYKDPQWVENLAPKGEAITLGLYHQIDVSHCLMLTEAQVYRMIAAQAFRDKNMADQLNSGHHSRLLVAGNFHIRRDFGVPNYAANSSEWVNIALMEVADSDDPGDYNLRSHKLRSPKPLAPKLLENQPFESVSPEVLGAGRDQVIHGLDPEAGLVLKPFDFIWFTPRWTDRDYCKDMQPIKSK